MIHGVETPFVHPVEVRVEAAEISIYDLPPNATSTEQADRKSVMTAPLDMPLRLILSKAVPRTDFGAGAFGPLVTFTLVALCDRDRAWGLGLGLQYSTVGLGAYSRA